MFAHWTVKKCLPLAFSAILALATAMMSVSLYNTVKLRETVSLNAHTYEVLAQSDTMLLNMGRIETGLHGFLDGGGEKSLELFKAGQQAFSVAFDKAKTLTSNNPAQQSHLEKLMVHHMQFMESASALMALRRDVTAGKPPSDALLREASGGKDEVAMDASRSRIAEFASEESRLLAARSAATDSTISASTRTLMAGGLVLFVLTVLAGSGRRLSGQPPYRK